MGDAYVANDWLGVLKWEGRLEDLLAMPTFDPWKLLAIFARAHIASMEATGCRDNVEHVVRLEQRRIALLGTLERFRDQGEAMVDLSQFMVKNHRETEAGEYLLRARKVAESHGFFSVESIACTFLGHTAIKEGRHAEGLDLLRNAVAAAPFNEQNDPNFAVSALDELVGALFDTGSTIDSPTSWIEEVEDLMPKYREAAKAEAQVKGFTYGSLAVYSTSARLCEVLSWTQNREPHPPTPDTQP